MVKYAAWIVAFVVVLGIVSTASAAWVVPAPVVVHSYYPVGPVYAYPAPVVVGYTPAAAVVRGPVVAPAPVYVAPAPAGVVVGPRGRVRAVVW